MKQKNFLESFKSAVSQGYGLSYGNLIRNYVDFLYNKLALHAHHPKFTGNFGYKDVSVREFDYKSVASYETADLNEGYVAPTTHINLFILFDSLGNSISMTFFLFSFFFQLQYRFFFLFRYVTVEELMDLQDAVDAFQKSVFKSLARGTNNNCRISALVPLVEESYGLYLFLTNMLQSLHRDRVAWDALEPLRDRYRDQFWMLKKFYDEARKLPYLTSLIVVPRLPDKPPEFYILSERHRPESDRARDIIGEPPRLLEDDSSSLINATPLGGGFSGVPSPSAAAAAAAVDINALRQTENALDEARLRTAELESILQQYATRMNAMDNELITLRSALQEGQFNWNRLGHLEEELHELRSNYDKLAKAYAQLNTDYQSMVKEHAQCGELRSKLDLSKREADTIRRAKENEMASISRERDQLRTQLETLTRAKGHEVQDIMKTATAERLEMERARETLAKDVQSLRAQLIEKDRTLNHLETDQLAVMDAGLEESARRIYRLEQRLQEEQQQHVGVITDLKENHRLQLDTVLGSVIESCRLKVQDALTAFDDPNTPGNLLATPEVTLSTGERLMEIGNDFTRAFLDFLKGSAPISEADAMAEAQALASAMEQLLRDAKGATRLADDPILVETLLSNARSTGKAAFNYFSVALPSRLRTLDKGITVITDSHDCFQGTVQSTMKSVEQLMGEAMAKTARLEGDLEDRVEKEMMGAAQAIDEATRRLEDIMTRQQQQQQQLQKNQGDTTQWSVHASLLEAAMVITNAIGNLIKAATATQHEIVANGSGGGKPGKATVFYKQNHRWTEGLISAAKMVASVVVVLVDVADGVVGGTRSMEDLMAASKEVGAATAQLVAAARVKKVRGGRTQEPLEKASQAIGDAVRNLVSAADKAIKQRQQRTTPTTLDLSKLSLHEMKIREMEVSSRILVLERQTAEERRRLADMRRSSYQTSM